ncbi:S-type pyocin domain-containing protein [Marinobacter sp. GN3S48]|uniref:S-type pyocin domain-containing protein n=1 Tax=Marinobacter sp. GN3S48 TaxID=3382302 RepID=UPI00387B2299
MTKIVSPHSLALHEALMIEGQWDQYPEKELASLLPSGVSRHQVKDQLASGELVLLSDTPSAPVFKLSEGKIVPADSNQIAISGSSVDNLERRFSSGSLSSLSPGRAGSDSLPPPSEPVYSPEPPVTDKPAEPQVPPVTISENFALPPLGPKVFAKSCTRPYGDSDSNEGEEKASNFGTLAVLAPATVAGNTAEGLRPINLVGGSASRFSVNWGVAVRQGASVLGTAVSGVMLALWPAKLGDGTLYTEEELAEMAEAAIRVRFQLHVDSQGDLRVSGYHVNGNAQYGDRVSVVHAERVGERFEVAVDEDLTLVWYPDESGNRPVTSTDYPADSGVDPYSILVTPIHEDGQELASAGYPHPSEEQIELIVSFPADSGIEPLYLVFRKTARDERGVVTGQGEDIVGTWLENAATDLGASIPSQIADRLRGREFSNFDSFREAFWLEVANDEELLAQFGSRNQKTIKAGRAPFTRIDDQVGKRNRFEIHHVEEIRNGGSVYDVNNMRVLTPSRHIEIHRKPL